jgi:hypothetical protein
MLIIPSVFSRDESRSAISSRAEEAGSQTARDGAATNDSTLIPPRKIEHSVRVQERTVECRQIR